MKSKLDDTFWKSMLSPKQIITDPDAIHPPLPPKYSSNQTFNSSFLSSIPKVNRNFSLKNILLRPPSNTDLFQKQDNDLNQPTSYV